MRMNIIKNTVSLMRRINDVNNENHSHLGFCKFKHDAFKNMTLSRATLNAFITPRFMLGVVGAIMLHVIVITIANNAINAQKIIADIYSVPTQISIRFAPVIQPQKAAPAPIEKITPEPIQKEPKKIAIKKQPPKKAPIKKVAVKKIEAAKPVDKQPTSNEVAFNTIAPAAAPASQPIVPAAPTAQNAPTKIPVISSAAANVKGRRIQPKYPQSALNRRQEGTVWLRVLLSESGLREDIKIRTPSKYALLNQAALKAVKRWKFAPTMVNGRPSKAWVDIPIEFKIQ